MKTGKITNYENLLILKSMMLLIRKMCGISTYIHNMLKVNLSPDKYYSFPYSFVYKKVAFQIAFGSFRKCIKNRVMPANLH